MATRKEWTREEIAKVLDLWPETDFQDICKELKVKPAQLIHIGKMIRKAGYKLPHKYRGSRAKSSIYIQELLKERGLIS